MADASATSKVFGTTELLEAVLTHLPMTAVFTVQAVCKSWRNVIKSSITLRKKQFLTTDAGTEVKIEARGGVYMENPQLKPMIAQLRTRDKTTWADGDASWKEMHALLPPVQKVTLSIERYLGSVLASHRLKFSLDEAAGVTMGDIFEALEYTQFPCDAYVVVCSGGFRSVFRVGLAPRSGLRHFIDYD